jgi:hypothetical protein
MLFNHAVGELERLLTRLEGWDDGELPQNTRNGKELWCKIDG